MKDFILFAKVSWQENKGHRLFMTLMFPFVWHSYKKAVKKNGTH